jgi:Ca2+-binding RTX toxin-like protein
MASFFNVLGSSTVTGTGEKDIFFAFSKDTNLDHIRADAILPTLTWTTAILQSDGTYLTLTATNIQVSTDLLLGGNGNDTVYGSNADDAIFYNNGVISGGIGSFDSIEQFFLGAGNDIIDLTAHGAGGVDYVKDVYISGGDGNDKIIGGAGKDTIDGGNGDDLIFGWRGADTIDGGNGNDIIYGDDLGNNGIAGDDTLSGSAGNDILYGGARSDHLDGGNDNDILYGGLGGDVLLGGNGDDVLYGDDPGTNGNDELHGGSGNDQLFGGGGDDFMTGDSGDDMLDGGTGNDNVNGTQGNDILVASGGNDILDGGVDIDTVVFSGARSDYSVVVNGDGSFTVTDLRSGSPDGTDTVRNVEFFQFTDGTVPAGALDTPPTITSNGGGDNAAVAIDENTAAVTIVTATDPDTGQTITYSIAGGADANLFTIDPVTGAVSFINAPDYENPQDADGDNVYNVIVVANDGNGGTDTQLLSVTVNDVVDGQPPVITSNGGGATAAVTIDENSTLATTVQATDGDSPTITYSIGGGADASLFTIDPVTGQLSFINAPDAEAPTDANHNGIYEVTVVASDGVNVDQQAISVTVANINDNAPTITSNGGGATANVNVAENGNAVTTVSAQDLDHDAVTYAITGGADASLFTIDPTTGALTFINSPNFEQPGDADHDNVYNVVVSASDGTNTDAQTLSVTVTNANDAPVITSNGGVPLASISIQENSTTVTTMTASDEDGTSPTYVIIGGADAALFQVDPVTGVVTFKSAPDFEVPLDSDHNNIYDVIIGASDGTAVASQELSITVTDVSETGRDLTGNANNNTFSPTQTVLAYQTTGLNDTIHALAGNDTIDGGAGADIMYGGTGNDVYYVDTYSDDGVTINDDQVIENVGEGTDLVNASVTYRLTDNVENLTLTGSAAINGYGNALANTINGNAAANEIWGDLGDDKLYGQGGNDTLHGGDGADTLDGGAGADIMDGGNDNDIYYVDTWSDDGNSTNDDQVIETATGGTDLVNASVSYTLASNVENLTLTGSAAINGTGNILNNIITGNSASNILNGDAGNDTLYGNGGDDFLYGGANIDRLEGGAGNDLLDGGAAADTLLGQAGNDTLIGGLARDVMTGGTEADTFVFGATDSTLNSASADVISDFTTGQDKIDLSFVSGSLAPSAYAEGTVATNAYADALAAANALMASGVHVVFIAGSGDGFLFYDVNGDGKLDQSVILTGVHTTGGFDSTDII